jgi:hypothetical protein
MQTSPTQNQPKPEQERAPNYADLLFGETSQSPTITTQREDSVAAPINYADFLFDPEAASTPNYADLLFGDSPVKEESSLLEPITTAVGSALEFVNRPSRAVAEAALALQNGAAALPGVKKALAGDSTASFEDVLAQRGMDPGIARTIAGFGLDVVTDPLNVVGGLPFKGARALAALPPLKRASAAVKSLPVVEDLGRKFVPHYNLPKAYADKRRLLDSEIGYKKAQAFEEAVERYKHVSPEEARTITKSLDKPAAPLGNPKLDALAAEQRKAFSEQAAREVEAGVLPPGSQVEDYVTYLFGGPVGETARAPLGRKLSSKNPFAKSRDLVSIEQALYLGAEPHIARIAAVRKATGDRAIAAANFFKKAVDDFSLPKDAAPAHFREVNIAGDMPIKEIFKGRVFEPSVADDLETLMRPGETRGALDHAFRVATGVWKGYATAMNPGFHFRNLVSNIFNSWLGGMPLSLAPVRYAEAAAWSARAQRGIGKYTAEQIDDAMRKYGVVGGGHGAFGEIASSLDELVARTKGPAGRVAQAVNPLSRHNVLQQGGRAVGQAVEDLSRRALFLDQLHKGKSLEDAALHVKKYLFDYGELTDFEKNVRDYALPFYVWLKKDVALQVESLLSQPHKYAHVGKAISEVEEASRDADVNVPRGDRPDWLQKTDSLQLPLLTSAGERVFLTPDLPYEDLNVFPVDAARKGQYGEAALDVLGDLFSRTNPFIKLPVELALNREVFTDRPIVDERIGPEQLVAAPAHLALVADASPAVATRLGMRKGISRRGEEQWMMPARPAYVAGQVPFFTKLGRMFSNADSDVQATIPTPLSAVGLPDMQPRHLNWLGFGLTAADDVQLAQRVAAKLREESRRMRGLSRQEALAVSPERSAAEELILRLVLSGQPD